MTDELRHRLAARDPLAGPLHEPIPPAPPAELLEHIMSTTDLSPAPRHTGRRRWAVVAGAAAAAVALAAGALSLRGGDEPAPLALGLPDGGEAMGMCMVFDTAILADMPVAFEGRATEVDGGQVTLEVTQWYAGGDDAEVVTLAAAPGMAALIDGIDFVEGRDYLVTATEGQVNFCGYSGLATDDLRAAFADAFGA